VGGQADDGGHSFQGKDRFGGQADQGEDELGHGNFAWQAVEKAALAGQALAIHLGQGGAQMGEVLLDELEKEV
jgi:hypothetical protein